MPIIGRGRDLLVPLAANLWQIYMSFWTFWTVHLYFSTKPFHHYRENNITFAQSNACEEVVNAIKWFLEKDIKWFNLSRWKCRIWKSTASACVICSIPKTKETCVYESIPFWDRMLKISPSWPSPASKTSMISLMKETKPGELIYNWILLTSSLPLFTIIDSCHCHHCVYAAIIILTCLFSELWQPLIWMRHQADLMLCLPFSSPSRGMT